MLIRLTLTFLLLVAGPVWGATDYCSTPYGTLSVTQAATGASTDTLTPLGDVNAIVLQYVRDGGTATVEAQICCTESCGASGDWSQVAGSSKSIDGTTTSAAIGITEPWCSYRTNITACSSCDIDIFYRCRLGSR